MKALTKLYAANSKSKSLKTTVPEEAVSMLKLSAGDSLEWVGYIEKSGKVIVELKKVE